MATDTGLQWAMTLVYITHVGISAYVCTVDSMTLVYNEQWHRATMSNDTRLQWAMTLVYNEQWHWTTLHTSAPTSNANWSYSYSTWCFTSNATLSSTSTVYWYSTFYQTKSSIYNYGCNKYDTGTEKQSDNTITQPRIYKLHLKPSGGLCEIGFVCGTS